MSRGSDLIAIARSKAGQWYYTNEEWARFHPEQSGGTDCSGFARWCYLQFGEDIGWWTGNESQAGYEIARGHYAWEIPWDIMQPGDLILMTATYWNLWDFSKYLCHIELYCGGGTMIGHPGGWGPQEKWAQAWMQSYGCITWMVRRVFESEDDVQAHDVWEYDYENTAPGGNMYNCVVGMSQKLDAAQPHSVWEYDYEGLTPQGNMYNCVVDMYKKIDQLEKTVESISVGAVDYEKLAVAVADKLAERMSD